MRMFTEVGRRVYTHCTGVGKGLLMQLSNDDVRQIVARAGMPAQTTFTITDPDALIADLEINRHRGYALNEGEQEIGVRCFAVPVRDAPIPTTISVSGPAARVTIDSADHVVPFLLRAAKDAKDLSAQFGDKP
jgi:IclR family transcriptional regulator, acetate operon repressor